MKEEWSPPVRTVEYEIDLIDAEPFEFVYNDLSKSRLLPLYIRVKYQWGKTISPDAAVEYEWTVFAKAIRGKVPIGGVRRVYHHKVRDVPPFVADIITRGMPVIP